VGLITPTLDNRRCDRCAAAGQRGTAERTFAPHWDPAYRMCSPCAAAVEILLTETRTLPQPDGAGGWTFPSHPAHTGAPDFLWCPEIRGFAAQVADHSAAVGASASPGAPAGASTRAGEAQALLGPSGASPLVASPPAEPVVVTALHARTGEAR
jgi:hypothetical protein